MSFQLEAPNAVHRQRRRRLQGTPDIGPSVAAWMVAGVVGLVALIGAATLMAGLIMLIDAPGWVTVVAGVAVPVLSVVLTCLVATGIRSTQSQKE